MGMAGRGIMGRRGGGFVDDFGQQSPQVINMVGRPRAGDEPGVAGTSNVFGPPGPGGRPFGPGMGPPMGGGGGGYPLSQPMSPYAARASRARAQIMDQQNEGATISPACDGDTMNSAACDPDSVKAAANPETVGGGMPDCGHRHRYDLSAHLVIRLCGGLLGFILL
jgi:hypothetical protein